MTKRQQTTIVLSHDEVASLRKLAAERGYLAERGIGVGAGSLSPLIRAIAAGDLVVLGPVMAWRDVASAVAKALAFPSLTDREREALSTVRNQMNAWADFDSDDI